MKRKSAYAAAVVCCIILALNSACSKEDNGDPHTITGPNIFNHECSILTDVPAEWIDSVKQNIIVHYAHTSHGDQLTVGLERIESSDPEYSVAIEYNTLPTETGALRIFDGQEDSTYITPDLYWETTVGMNFTRAVLNNNPTINVSMWAWCTQLDGYDESQVQAYLDAITTLAGEFPEVTFVLFTGNAQATDADGYNRHQRNQQVRQYCNDHDLACFDFGDLDAWYYDGSAWDQATYAYDTVSVPREHENFQGDEAGHTTYISCEQKGRAVWWMLARIAGWQGP